MSGDAVQLTGINPGRCPRCGGELEFKANVGSLGEGSETYFSECSDCDHIHTVNEKRVNTDADRYLREFTVFIVVPLSPDHLLCF
jgi:hypothetical protein